MPDSEEDLPIVELLRRRKRNEAKQALTQQDKVKKVKTSDNGKKVKTENNEQPAKATKSSTSSATTTKTSSSTANLSTEFYESTPKGLLVQRLMLRWWYAIEWPDPKEIPEPPAGYEPLDGFYGVFISTRVDSLGTIVDLRNKETCPNLVNLSKMPSAKVKELCITAYEKQMEELLAHEGDCKLLHTLKSELKEVKQVDPNKADKLPKRFHFEVKKAD